MSEKRIIGRAIQKHDIEENWLKATNFTPMQGEIIVYDIDKNYNYERFKIGDGESNVNDLPFAGSDLSGTVLYTPQTLTEEQQTQARTNIGAVSEEDVKAIIEGPQINGSGEFIELELEKDVPLSVVSKIHRDSTWEPSNQLVLHQVNNTNFVDLTTYLGGPGTVFETNGVTATINDNSTVTIQGTNTSTNFTAVINKYKWDSTTIYPAGTYTISSGFAIAIRAAQYPEAVTIPGATGNLRGTITVSEPFRIIMVMYDVGGSASVDVTLPLGLFYNGSIPETGYEYSGNTYSVTFDRLVYEGEFNWITGELKDFEGNTVGYYDTHDIVSLEGTNYFWTGFGENAITYRKNDGAIVIQLNETVPETTVPSICDFNFTPNTPFCLYSLANTNLTAGGKFAGREIPMLTTTGDLKVIDSNGNTKFKKRIDSMIGLKNRAGWTITDTLTQNGLHKVWSKKFYLTMSEDATREEIDYSGAKNSVHTFEFDESDFAETGIPAKLDNIPVASPCFVTGVSSTNWLNERVYGNSPFPLKFSYNQETGKYVMTIRTSSSASLIFYELNQWSKSYIYYQLETPYDENDLFAMGLEHGDRIVFEDNYSELQEYIDTEGFFQLDRWGTAVTEANATPTVSAIVPQNTIDALNGFNNAAKIFNNGQSSSGDDTVQDYSWIGDGDGVTDYTSKIQNKIKELKTISDGGTIFLGNGVYNISNFIELTDNIKLIGTGNTTIQQTNKNEHVIVLSGSNVVIKDIQLKLYTMTAQEKDDPSSYNSELTACVFVNSNNIPSRDNYNNKYLQNTYCKNLTMDNVSLSGSYGFRYIDGYPVISNDYEYYRGCGLIQTQLFFNYATLTNVHISGMYHGLHNVGGSNDVTIFCESCKTMVYGGGGYANLNIYGHSYYATDKDGQVISMSDEVGHFTNMEQSYIAEYVYDVQWMKNIFVFDGYAMNNRYLISQIAGCSYYKNELTSNTKLKHWVIDYGRGNRGIENYQNTPYHIGTKYIDKTTQTSFKANDPITQNALSGAGVWGSITSTDEFGSGSISLSEVCRYPTDENVDKHTNNTAFLFALSNNTPTEENPIEILIDISNRPIKALPGAFIQFSESYIASDFSVSFDLTNDNTFSRTIEVKDNMDTVWYSMNHQVNFEKIYRIKIVITKALYIESLKYQNSAYVNYEIEYNPDRKVGICNVGIIDADFAGRSFLGECGGNVYGDLILNKDSTIKNVPTPIEDSDAVNKAYVDSINTENAVSTYYDTIINSQEEFNEMIADPSWFGAKNILLNCNVSFGQDPLTSSSPIYIPDNINLINGNWYAISADYWNFIGNNKIIIKNAHLDWQRTTMSGIYGFYNCSIIPQYEITGAPANITAKHVINMTYTGDLAVTGPATFSNCENIWLTTEQAAKFDTTNIGEAELHIVDEIPSYVYISRLSDLENNLGTKDGEGLSSTVSGSSEVAALGDYSFAHGYTHGEYDENGEIIIYKTKAIGTGSTAMGKGSATYAKQSVAIGCRATTGQEGFTDWDDDEDDPFYGTYTPGEDLGKNSAAFGYADSSWGVSTLTAGTSNTAKGMGSVALGSSNRTYSYGSTAVGFNNIAGNANDEFFGHKNGPNTLGAGAVAFGVTNQSKGTASFVAGANNLTSVNYQTVFGRYNKENEKAALIVGNGTSGSSRSNLLTVSNESLCYGNTTTNTEIILKTLDTYVTDTTPILTNGGYMLAIRFEANTIPPYLAKGDRIRITASTLTTPLETKIEALWFNGTYANKYDGIRFNPVEGNKSTENEEFLAFKNALVNISADILNLTVELLDVKHAVSFGANQPAPVSCQTAVGYNGDYDADALFIVGNGSTTTPNNAFSVKQNGEVILGDVVINNKNISLKSPTDTLNIVQDFVNIDCYDYLTLYGKNGIDVSGSIIKNLSDPIDSTDATNKNYVDNKEYNDLKTKPFEYDTTLYSIRGAGGNTITNAQYSIAFGQANTIGRNSVTRGGHAFGYKNKVYGGDSLAFGAENTIGTETANANRTFVAGVGNNTSHSKSVLLGENLITGANSQILFGKNNKQVGNDTILVVGSGTSSATADRANALEVKTNGDIIIQGNILNPDGTSKLKALEDRIAALEAQIAALTNN